MAKRLSPLRNDNNVHDRTFLAGNYLKIGWPSINIMSSSDFKCVALTDYDRFPEDIDGEGDGFTPASKRTTTFMSAGMTLVECSRAGTFATANGAENLPMKHHQLQARFRCTTVEIAVAGTGRARIVVNIFSLRWRR